MKAYCTEHAMDFLYDHLPQSDIDCYPRELFGQFAEHARMLRTSAPWCSELDQEIFDHYVLFPRVNDEDLSFHRSIFYDALWPRIRELSTMEQRILEVNRWCHEMASYQMQDDRTASPLTVLRSGSGRCGEESAFLVSALRSVGIPARQVYTPRWAHCDDNHAWVEALCDGQWRFLGACEPEPILNRGWFNTPASRAILVHSRIFGIGNSPLHGEFLCREGGVCWYNQTARYAQTRTYAFQVLRDGAPAMGAVVQIQVLNEAGFHTIATLTADENGEARAALGLGDFHVLATLGELWAEQDCSCETISLHLEPIKPQSTPWTDFDVHAPVSAPVNPADLTPSQRVRRAAENSRGDALRRERIAAFRNQYPGKPQWNDSLDAARGNRAVIAAFLERDSDPRREALLRSLSLKDLRDVTLEILEDHLQNTPKSDGIPEEIYFSYVLCPRIEWEPLTPWRRTLRGILPAKEPASLWAYLKSRIHNAQTYANLSWTPAEAWQSGRCNERSLRILYVALLRANGIPARLRTLDGMPEYWRGGDFHPIVPEPTGTLRLTCPGNSDPLYRQNWTLSRRTSSGWKLLNLSGSRWQDGSCTVSLPAGVYRLATSVRLPNGNQYAARRELEIRCGGAACSDLRLRAFSLEDMLSCQELPKFSAATLDGTPLDRLPSSGAPALLFWLEEGTEPTEHVLSELAAHRAELESLPAKIIFFLQGRDSLAHPGLSGLLCGWDGIRVLISDWRYDLENVARAMTCDPDASPLAVVCNREGKAVYGASGYRVGLVELLIRIVSHLCT